MSAPTVALIVVASAVEAGGDRGPSIIAEARAELERAGLEVVGPSGVVWGAGDSITGTRGLPRADLVVLIHCSWIVDSLQFELVHSLDAPFLLWALPYPETFSLASVKHASSILTSRGIVHHWGYGETGETAFSERVVSLARAAATARRFRSSRAGLITSRSTWRTAGPQDTTNDEWDLAQSLGITIVHLPVRELVSTADSFSDADADRELEAHQAIASTAGLDSRRVRFGARTYLAVKRLIATYKLDALAVACYPDHFGLVNLAASWLADEGIYLDPEGDIGHAVLANAMLALDPHPVALAESVLVDEAGDRLFLRHEGSSPASLAAEPAVVEIGALGEDRGLVVEFPLRPIPTLTIAGISGADRRYRMWAGRVSSPGIDRGEWQALGRGFLAAIRPESGGAKRLLERMFATGMDHHLVMQAGDRTAVLSELARFWGFEFVPLAA